MIDLAIVCAQAVAGVDDVMLEVLAMLLAVPAAIGVVAGVVALVRKVGRA